MIGNSLPEYIFIRASIACLRLVAPLSVAYTLTSLYAGEILYCRWLGLYAIAETIFYAFVYVPRSYWLQKAAVHPPPLSKTERETLFLRCVAHMAGTNMTTGWFFNSPETSIKRDNMKEWLLWALFSARPDGMKQEWVEEIEDYLTRVEEATGSKLPRGCSETVKSMRTTLDPVVTVHRPLFWYLIVSIVDTITCTLLLRGGFKHCNTSSIRCFPPRWISLLSQPSPQSDLVYWYRPHRSKTKPPVLFLHGIGIGLWPYVTFLREIAAEDPEVGIMAIENLAVSMHITYPPLHRPAMLSALTRVLDHHGLPTFILAAHSYGTVLAAHILRDAPLAARVASTLLVDPIPFLLYLPAVAYNFVYREPRTANEWQLWYFASRDPDIARALSRHFFWFENMLWKDDLDGRSCAIVLCGRDQIVDAKQVRRYLTGTDETTFRWEKDGLEVLYYPDLDHSQQFDYPDRRQPMVKIISRFLHEGYDGRKI